MQPHGERYRARVPTWKLLFDDGMGGPRPVSAQPGPMRRLDGAVGERRAEAELGREPRDPGHETLIGALVDPPELAPAGLGVDEGDGPPAVLEHPLHEKVGRLGGIAGSVERDDLL